MSILPNFIYKFNEIIIKYLNFCRDEYICVCVWGGIYQWFSNPFLNQDPFLLLKTWSSKELWFMCILPINIGNVFSTHWKTVRNSFSINTSINAIFTFGVENCNRQQADSHISLCIPSVAICGFGEVCEDKLTSLKNVTAKGWS